MKKFTVEENQKLKTFTDNFFPQGSFAFSRLIRDKDIKINGKKVGENKSVFVGDEIVYYTTQKEENATFFDVVYEDENVLIADKYSGVNSEALFYHLSQKGEYYFIHRLDRNTSGLIIFAKNKATEKTLLNAFKQKKVKKVYHAICCNPFKKQAEVLCDYLIKDEKNAKVKVYSCQKPNSQKITTEYKVLKNLGDCSLVELVLHSGKTHQIRAHMAFYGNAVVGDEKYGNGQINKKYGVKRQLLVAKQLSFIDAEGLENLNGHTFYSKFSAELKIKG